MPDDDANLPATDDSALRAALSDHSNQSLAGKTEAELYGTPVEIRARIAYASALIRITDFLRTAPSDFSEAHAQANTAFRFMKHIEGTNLELLRLDKSTARSAILVSEMAKMRGDLSDLAEARARDIIRRRDVLEAQTIDVEPDPKPNVPGASA